MGLKDKLHELQLRTQLKQFAYIMPADDRKDFEKAAATEERIMKKIRGLGITQKELDELYGAFIVKEIMIKKHRKKFQERVKGVK